jgi:hypothetical protein
LYVPLDLARIWQHLRRSAGSGPRSSQIIFKVQSTHPTSHISPTIDHMSYPLADFMTRLAQVKSLSTNCLSSDTGIANRHRPIATYIPARHRWAAEKKTQISPRFLPDSFHLRLPYLYLISFLSQILPPKFSSTECKPTVRSAVQQPDLVIFPERHRVTILSR